MESPLKYWPLLVLFWISNILKCALAQAGSECHFNRLTPRHGLDMHKMMGDWFLQEFAASDRSFDNVQPHFRCNKLTFVHAFTRSSGMDFFSRESLINTTTGNLQTVTTKIHVPAMVSPASATWVETPENGHVTGRENKMMILGSDPDHSKWFIWYTCNISGRDRYRWETVTVWTRKMRMDPVLRDALKGVLVGLGLPLQSHKQASQEGC